MCSVLLLPCRTLSLYIHSCCVVWLCLALSPSAECFSPALTGMVLGPCMNLITAAADFTVLGVDVADTNGPGLLMALILATLLLVVMAVLREPLDYKQASASKQQELVKEVLKEICRPAVATCCPVIFTFNMYISASEAVDVPVTQHATKLHFSPLQNSFVYAGLSSWMLVLSILIMLFGKRLSDRGLLLFADVFYGTAVVRIHFQQ